MFSSFFKVIFFITFVSCNTNSDLDYLKKLIKYTDFQISFSDQKNNVNINLKYFSTNRSEIMRIASLSKIVTGYIILDYLRKNNISLNNKIFIRNLNKKYEIWRLLSHRRNEDLYSNDFFYKNENYDLLGNFIIENKIFDSISNKNQLVFKNKTYKINKIKEPNVYFQDNNIDFVEDTYHYNADFYDNHLYSGGFESTSIELQKFITTNSDFDFELKGFNYPCNANIPRGCHQLIYHKFKYKNQYFFWRDGSMTGSTGIAIISNQKVLVFLSNKRFYNWKIENESLLKILINLYF